MTASGPLPAAAQADQVTVSDFGDLALLVSTAYPHRVAEAVRSLTLVRDTVPVPGAVTVLLDPAVAIEEAVYATVVGQVQATAWLVNRQVSQQGADAAPAGREMTVPVCYDGPDLAAVADLLGVSVEEVIARHSGAVYAVTMLGFAPGFPYLDGGDPLFAQVPRLALPRPRVQAGSVGVAAGRSCVYTTDSPGGWMLLGRALVPLFAPEATCPALLQPGDTVRFVPTGPGGEPVDVPGVVGAAR